MSIVRNVLMEMLSDSLAHLMPEASEHPGTTAIELDIPKIPEHGDYATNVALALTRQLKQNPREIARKIVDGLNDSDNLLQKVEIAGPGFINFFFHPRAWHKILTDIIRDPQGFGRLDLGKGRRIQVEFVSANPTGPLHIGHGRGAATGDVLANILDACGYAVEREYYINDAGNQMDTLGRSLYYRYQEALGESIDFPDAHYQGEYMKELARDFITDAGKRYLRVPLDEVLPVFTRFAADRILDGIKDDLNGFGVSFDRWFSERSLHAEDSIRRTVEELTRRGFIYESEGAVWFKSTAFGDEKDRVVIRANGISTYFAADLAYHKNKYDRGYDTVVDIWGADHHGYVERMLAGVEALGRDRTDLKIVLVQLVNLLRAGKPVAMSTRAGEFVTLREVIDEVGRDASRFIFLTRRSDSQLDFDLDVAKAKTNDNPVFYVQYAHARLCSIFQVAAERGVSCDWPGGDDVPDLTLLTLAQELQIIKFLGEYPAVLANCARSMEPHLIPYYLHELVSLFHSYYNHNRVLGDEPELTRARLFMAAAIREVIRNALGLLGVSAPEKM
jgi:arginyl-tRNA synthetase